MPDLKHPARVAEEQAMREPCIMPIVPGSISKADRRALTRAGVVVIEHAEPHELRIIRPTLELQGSDILVAALKAIAAEGKYNNECHREFSAALCKILEGGANHSHEH